MITIADTSVLLASADRADPLHRQCRAVLSGAVAGTVVISPLVMAELDYLIGSTKTLGPDASLAMLRGIAQREASGRFILGVLDAELLAHAMAVMTRYRELAPGLTDAVNVGLAARYATTRIMTLDQRHFRVMRPLANGPAFTILPFDDPSLSSGVPPT
ncbi:PIN domain-containing protein [Streptacidiphilus fuscans]|uniref:Ribonuclease VapC n=1 Tax=Streptacidiphilus fuscans TaxID=2789292 RepID=A0A931FFI2_9ACTN|nr:PIN domain-containing protein [Streptacidiphilus fuscans]MBF9068434.1 PIN domain-containing protein [Streptacidiphilus fuscans]